MPKTIKKPKPKKDLVPSTPVEWVESLCAKHLPDAKWTVVVNPLGHIEMTYEPGEFNETTTWWRMATVERCMRGEDPEKTEEIVDMILWMKNA